MLTKKQKHAIENLLILADYIKEHSIYSDRHAEIIDESITICEQLTGKTIREGNVIELGECNKEAIIKAMQDRFRS